MNSQERNARIVTRVPERGFEETSRVREVARYRIIFISAWHNSATLNARQRQLVYIGDDGGSRGRTQKAMEYGRARNIRLIRREMRIQERD